MNIYLIYGTLSGSTMTVAEIIASSLRSSGHTVNVTTADSASKDDLKAAEAFIVGSPSWEDQGKDGQPLPELTNFLSTLIPGDLANKKIAVFGLGDIAYPHFCGAVDIMEARFKELGVTPILGSLKIDRYYSLQDNEQKVKAWAAGLASVLK